MANWPMDDTAVVNASPFIFLSRADRLDLLHDICGKILIPQAVADEILLNGPEDISAQALINDTRDRASTSMIVAFPHIDTPPAHDGRPTGSPLPFSQIPR